jgi:hypothetical protein
VHAAQVDVAPAGQASVDGREVGDQWAFEQVAQIVGDDPGRCGHGTVLQFERAVAARSCGALQSGRVAPGAVNVVKSVVEAKAGRANRSRA